MPLWRERNTQQMIDEELRRKKELEERRRAQIAQQMDLSPPMPSPTQQGPFTRPEFSTPPAQQATVRTPQPARQEPIDSGLLAEMRRMGGIDDAYQRPFETVHRDPIKAETEFEKPPKQQLPETDLNFNFNEWWQGFLSSSFMRPDREVPDAFSDIKGDDLIERWMSRYPEGQLSKERKERLESNIRANPEYFQRRLATEDIYAQEDPQGFMEQSGAFLARLMQTGSATMAGSLPLEAELRSTGNDLLDGLADTAGFLSSLTVPSGVPGTAFRIGDLAGMSVAPAVARNLNLNYSLVENAVRRGSAYGLLGAVRTDDPVDAAKAGLAGAIGGVAEHYAGPMVRFAARKLGLKIPPVTDYPGQQVGTAGQIGRVGQAAQRVAEEPYYLRVAESMHRTGTMFGTMTASMGVMDGDDPKDIAANTMASYFMGSILGGLSRIAPEIRYKIGKEKFQTQQLLAELSRLERGGVITGHTTPRGGRALQFDQYVRSVLDSKLKPVPGRYQVNPKFTKSGKPETVEVMVEYKGKTYPLSQLVDRSVLQKMARLDFGEMPRGMQFAGYGRYQPTGQLGTGQQPAGAPGAPGTAPPGAQPAPTGPAQQLPPGTTTTPISRPAIAYSKKTGKPAPWQMTSSEFTSEYQSSLEQPGQSARLRELTGQRIDPQTGEVTMEVTTEIQGGPQEVWSTQVSEAIKRGEDVPSEVKVDYYSTTKDLMRTASDPAQGVTETKADEYRAQRQQAMETLIEEGFTDGDKIRQRDFNRPETSKRILEKALRERVPAVPKGFDAFDAIWTRGTQTEDTRLSVGGEIAQAFNLAYNYIDVDPVFDVFQAVYVSGQRFAFFNTRYDSPPAFTAMHEIEHNMFDVAPGLHDALEGALLEHVEDEYDLESMKHNRDFMHELVADYMGELSTHPHFWEQMSGVFPQETIDKIRETGQLTEENTYRSQFKNVDQLDQLFIRTLKRFQPLAKEQNLLVATPRERLERAVSQMTDQQRSNMREDIQMQKKKAQDYTLKTRRAIEKMGEKQTTQQVRKLLQKEGVKKAEIDQLGIESYLNFADERGETRHIQRDMLQKAEELGVNVTDPNYMLKVPEGMVTKDEMKRVVDYGTPVIIPSHQWEKVGEDEAVDQQKEQDAEMLASDSLENYRTYRDARAMFQSALRLMNLRGLTVDENGARLTDSELEHLHEMIEGAAKVDSEHALNLADVEIDYSAPLPQPNEWVNEFREYTMATYNLDQDASLDEINHAVHRMIGMRRSEVLEDAFKKYITENLGHLQDSGWSYHQLFQRAVEVHTTVQVDPDVEHVFYNHQLNSPVVGRNRFSTSQIMDEFMMHKRSDSVSLATMENYISFAYALCMAKNRVGSRGSHLDAEIDFYYLVGGEMPGLNHVPQSRYVDHRIDGYASYYDLVESFIFKFGEYSALQHEIDDWATELPGYVERQDPDFSRFSYYTTTFDPHDLPESRIPHKEYIEMGRSAGEIKGLEDSYGFYQAVYDPEPHDPRIRREWYDPPSAHQLDRNAIWHFRHQDIDVYLPVDPKSTGHPEGVVAFHLEEIQSDAFRQLREAMQYKRLKELEEQGVELVHKDRQALEELENVNIASAPPEKWEPIVSNWLEHSLKQAIQLAARNDYEAFTFTTPQIQKNRWSVSTVVDTVVFVKNKKEDGPYGWLYAYRGHRNPHIEYVNSKGHLMEIIGREQARELENRPMHKILMPVDIPVHDWVETMKSFLRDYVQGKPEEYDKIIKSYEEQDTPLREIFITDFLGTFPDTDYSNAEAVYHLSGQQLDIKGHVFDLIYDKKVKQFLKKYLKQFGVELTELDTNTVARVNRQDVTVDINEGILPEQGRYDVGAIRDKIGEKMDLRLEVLKESAETADDGMSARESSAYAHIAEADEIAMRLEHVMAKMSHDELTVYPGTYYDNALTYAVNAYITNKIDNMHNAGVGDKGVAMREIEGAIKSYLFFAHPATVHGFDSDVLFDKAFGKIDVKFEHVKRPGFRITPAMKADYPLFREKGERPPIPKKDKYSHLPSQSRASVQRAENSIKAKLQDPDNYEALRGFIETSNKIDAIIGHYEKSGTLSAQEMDSLKTRKTTPISQMEDYQIVQFMNATKNYINHLIMEGLKEQRLNAPEQRTEAEENELKNYAFDAPIEKRWKGARNMRPPGAFAKIGSAIQEFKDGFSRSHKHLPNKGYYMPLRDGLINLSKSSSVAGEEAVMDMKQMLQDIANDTPLYNLFERYVVMADLLEDYKRYHEMLKEEQLKEEDRPYEWRFDFTKETFAQEWKRINSLVNRHPAVKRAIKERKVWWENFIDRYVEAQRAIGHEVEQRFTRESYYHRQVLDYAHMKTSAISLKKMKTPRGRDWLKSRTVEGSDLDFNTNYLEAEFEVISQMHADIYKAEVLKMIEDKYSYYDELVAKADEYNQDRPLKQHKQWHEFMDEIQSPEGEAITPYYPTDGNIFYMATTIPDNIATQLFNEQIKAYGVKKGDLRRALVVGARHKPLVVDENIAATLDDLIQNDKAGSAIGELARELLTFWKKYQLVSPPRYIKYNLRNLSSDIEFPISLNLGTFRHMGTASRDLHNHLIKKKTTREDTELDIHGDNHLWAWIVRGGMQSNLQAQEMGEINKIDDFAKIAKQYSTWQDVPGEVWDKYWKSARLTTDFRESILRYASFIDYVNQMKANVDPENLDSSGVIIGVDDHRQVGLPDNYGGSIKEEIQELDNIYSRAYWLSNELCGAYDRVSQYGMLLRKYVMPFWSWKEVNFKRFTRILKNTGHDPQILENIGRYAINKMQRAVGGGAITPNTPIPKNNMSRFAKAPLIAMRIGLWLLRAGGLWISTQIWNNLAFPGHQYSIPERDRRGFYLVVGRTEDGYLYYNRLGFMTDLFEWIGDTPWNYANDYIKGRKTAMQVAEDIAQAPAKVLISALGPHLNTVYELVTGSSLFPDPSRPSPIRDPYRHIAQNFGLTNTYDRLTGRPSRNWGDELQRIFAYKQLHNQGAYHDTRNEVRDYQRSIDVATGRFFPDYSDRSTALFYLRQAIAMEDKEALERYAMEYLAHGGTREGLETSLRNMHPLYGLNEERRQDFVHNWLDEEGRKRAVRAIDYYENVVLGGDWIDLGLD